MKLHLVRFHFSLEATGNCSFRANCLKAKNHFKRGITYVVCFLTKWLLKVSYFGKLFYFTSWNLMFWGQVSCFVMLWSIAFFVFKKHYFSIVLFCRFLYIWNNIKLCLVSYLYSVAGKIPWTLKVWFWVLWASQYSIIGGLSSAHSKLRKRL